MSETKPVQLVTVLVYVQINISHVWKFHISEIVLAPTISDMRGSTVLPKEYTVRHQWGNTHNVGGRGYSLLSVTKSPKHIHSTVHRTSITECLYLLHSHYHSVRSHCFDNTCSITGVCICLCVECKRKRLNMYNHSKETDSSSSTTTV